LPRLLGVWLVLGLSACNTAGVRDDDPSGDLGVTRQNRPGDIYAQMGQEYMREGQPAIALRKLKRGLEHDPDNANIHAVLGRLYEQLGEVALAQEHYSQASHLAPQNPYYHNAWGGFLCQQEHYEQADEQFRLALNNPLYNTPWAAHTNAGVCAYRAGKLKSAETYLRAALSANPRIPLALSKMAQIHLDKGDYINARSYLERYRALLPHTPESLLLGVRIELGANHPDGVLRYKTVLEALYPDAPETLTARELTQQ
jgi:type IV pilus assembly protein PilF